MPKTKKRTRASINRPLMWTATAAIIVAILAAYFLTRPTNTSSQTGTEGSIGQAPAEFAKNSSNQSHSQVVQGGAQDNKGTDLAQTPSSDWTSSANGVITLKSPPAESTLKSGDIVSGDAKVDTVQYRLVDDEVGVLAQGSLSVVDGKFSGKILFRPQAKTGNLDIFSYNSSGAEINRLSIKVNLGS